ncbi:hypothetical protein ACTRXD_14425 [Nitrospira sp. T9]
MRGQALFKRLDVSLTAHGLQPRRDQPINASLVPIPKQGKSQEKAVFKAG